MKRRTAWVLLLLTGIPTPALWRPASSSNTSPARRAGSSPNGLRVTVRVLPVPLAHGAPSAQPVASPAWLSDDPDVAALLAAVPAAPPAPAATPPRPRTRRQAVATAPGASSLPAQQLAAYRDAPARPSARKPRTKAEHHAAASPAWPSTWGQLADAWDASRGA